MKKLFLLLILSICAFLVKAQDYKGYIVEGYDVLQAHRAFVIDNDTFYATTQVSVIDTITLDTIITDTILVSLEYLKNNYPELPELTDSLAKMTLQRVTDNGDTTSRAITVGGMLSKGQIAIANVTPRYRWYEIDFDIGWDVVMVNGDLAFTQTNSAENEKIVFKDTAFSEVVIIDTDDASVSLDIVKYNPNYSETGNEPVGSRFWNPDIRTTSLRSIDGTTLDDGHELWFHVLNQTGAQLTNGYVAAYAGSLGMSAKNLAMYGIADYDIMPPEAIMGVFTQDLSNGEEGKVTWFGDVRGIPTNGSAFGEVWEAGDTLYVSPYTMGWLTNVQPQAPYPAIFIAVVKSVHASNGAITVRPTFPQRVQDAPDVNGTPLTESGQILVWNQDSMYFDFDYNIWPDLISNEVYSDTWDSVFFTAPSKNAVYDKIEQLTTRDYCPDTTIVNRGTISGGSIDSLCAKDGQYLTVQELSGADPLRITFSFTNVERMNYFIFYGAYMGGAAHVLSAEIYNPTTMAWDFLGTFGLDATPQWHSFPIYLPSDYISGGNVQTRIRHVTSGVPSHLIMIDYVDINFGGGGGGTPISAGEVSFSPYDFVTGTNVQSGMQQIVDEVNLKENTSDYESTQLDWIQSGKDANSIKLSLFGSYPSGPVPLYKYTEIPVVNATYDGLMTSEQLDSLRNNSDSIIAHRLDIDTNTDSIVANELRISQNEADILELQDSITVHRTDINQNATDIQTALAYTWDDVMHNGNITDQQANIVSGTNGVRITATGLVGYDGIDYNALTLRARSGSQITLNTNGIVDFADNITINGIPTAGSIHAARMIDLQNALDDIGFDGALTDGYLPNATGSGTTLENSPVYTNGTNILLGTTTDNGYKLDVNGTGMFRGTLTFGVVETISKGYGDFILEDTNPKFTFRRTGLQDWDFYSSSTSFYIEPQVSDGIYRIRNLANTDVFSIATSTGYTQHFSQLGNGYGYSATLDDLDAALDGLDISQLTLVNSMVYWDGINLKTAGWYLNNGSVNDMRLGGGGERFVIQQDLSDLSNRTSSIGILDNGSITGLYIKDDNTLLSNNYTALMVNGSHKITAYNTGNVSIGTPTDNGYKLDVNGIGRFSNTFGNALELVTNANSATRAWTLFSMANSGQQYGFKLFGTDTLQFSLYNYTDNTPMWRAYADGRFVVQSRLLVNGATDDGINELNVAGQSRLNGEVEMTGGATVADAPVVDTDVLRKIDVENASLDIDGLTLSYNGADILQIISDSIATVGGTDSYISNVSESGNNITFTGVGSAYNSSIGSIAKTDIAQSFSASASSAYILQLINTNSFGSGLRIAADNTPLFVESRVGIDLFSVSSNGAIDMDLYGGGTFPGTTSRVISVSSTGDVLDVLTLATGTTDNTQLATKGYVDDNAGGTSYWETFASGIRPTSSAYEVYLGGVADQGVYNLQTAGSVYFGGQALNAPFAAATVDQVVAASSVDAGDKLILQNQVSTETGTTGVGKLQATPSALYFIPSNAALANLNTALDITSTSTNTYSSSGHTHVLASNSVTNAKMADDAVGIAELSATGTPSSSTYLRGDNTWATISGGGTITGSGVSGRVTYWNGTSSITSDTDFTFDGLNLRVGATNGTGNVNSGNFTLTSDKRLKKNIRAIKDLEKYDDIEFVQFKMKGDDSYTRYGVIAQDVKKINSNLVRTDDAGIYSVSYIDLLIAKTARQENRINELESKLELLIKKVEDLENEK